MASVCLAMIVKDESHVVARALASIRPYISSWVVCDTGSTDDTMEIVQEALAGIPGELHRHEWVDFAHNRNRALAAAATSGADYMLSLDADEWLVVDNPAAFQGLALDSYYIPYAHQDVNYAAHRLVRLAHGWRWVGELHEYLDCERPATWGMLAGVRIETDEMGSRSQDPEEHAKDLALLERMVEAEPGNQHHWFYLAQAYLMLGRQTDALAAYRRCAALTGNAEAIAYSRYRIALLTLLQGDWLSARQAFLEAYAADTRRAEPLFWLAHQHLARGEWAPALPLLELCGLKDKPENAVYVEESIYDYNALRYYAIALAMGGKHEDARQLAGYLLRSGDVPEDVIPDLARLMGMPDTVGQA